MVMSSVKLVAFVSAVCFMSGITMAYPQTSRHNGRFFLTKRQASFDEFNYLQSAPTSRPCIPMAQYRRSNDASSDTRKAFYLSYPSYMPSRPNTNSASYNTHSGYYCDQSTTYQPVWMNIANLFDIFLGSNNLQTDSSDIRPVFESNDHSNENTYQRWPGPSYVGGISNTVNGYYQNMDRPLSQHQFRQ